MKRYYIDSVIAPTENDPHVSEDNQTQEMYTGYISVNGNRSEVTHLQCVCVYARTGDELTQRLIKMIQGLNQ